MRVTAYQASVVCSGYILIVEVLDQPDEYHVTGDRQSYAGLLALHTGRAEVLQVHSRRMAPAHEFGKATPTPIVAEDFGTMAGYWWSGDEFALDGRGDVE